MKVVHHAVTLLKPMCPFYKTKAFLIFSEVIEWVHQPEMGQRIFSVFNLLSANPTKWSNSRQNCQQPKNCLSVFDHFVGLALKGLILPKIRHLCHQFKI